jgi:hypothetical protein
VILASVALHASCSPCDFGQTLTLTATVGSFSAAFAAVKPAGGDAISFHDGDKILNAGATSATSPIATRTERLSPGTHSLFATIQAVADGFIGRSSTLAVKVNPIPTSMSLSASPDPVITGSMVTFNTNLVFNTILAGRVGADPTGVIAIKVGSVVNSVPIGQTLVNPAPAPGVYTVTAVYNGDTNYAAVTSLPVTLIVTGSSPASASVPFIGVVSADGTWNIRNQLSSGFSDATFLFQLDVLHPVTGDWTGSGHSGIGAFDPTTGFWFLRNERSAGSLDAGLFNFGAQGAVPVTGDWDGNGTTTVGLFNPATAIWLLNNQNSDMGSSDPILFQFGEAGAGVIPVTGDWDGNGTTTVGTFDPTTAIWSLRNENSAGAPDAGIFVFGSPGMVPVTGKWTGTRQTGIGVYDPNTGTWFLRNSLSFGPADFTFVFGPPGSIPITGKQ